jgi:hypothetical protein
MLRGRGLVEAASRVAAGEVFGRKARRSKGAMSGSHCQTSQIFGREENGSGVHVFRDSKEWTRAKALYRSKILTWYRVLGSRNF